MKLLRSLFVAGICASTSVLPAFADEIDKSRVPPIETYKLMLDGNRQNGWVQFRNYDGRQWIYFTAMQTLHCRLKEIRYSVNSKDLDKTFDLVKCNPQTPFSMPEGFGTDDVAIVLDLNAAQTIAVQVVWEDDSVSDVAVYEPCKDVGERSCAWPLE